jgi:hypothetical protein
MSNRLELVLAATAGLLVTGGVFLLWRRRPPDPEQIEQRRRTHVNRVGRIIEGEILEIVEDSPRVGSKARTFLKRASLPPAPSVHDARKLVMYTYSISGVTYQAAQDVTGLEERTFLERVATGQVASVKYDPTNPGNSILIAEGWSGLR